MLRLGGDQVQIPGHVRRFTEHFPLPSSIRMDRTTTVSIIQDMMTRFMEASQILATQSV
jgi:hypothetical protein